MGANGTSGQPSSWKLEDAKARFSEVVRLASERGPQRVTVRGRDAVVIVSAEDYARLVPPLPEITLAQLFDSLPPTSHIDADFEPVRLLETVRASPEF